jgi:hypothetical protein
LHVFFANTEALQVYNIIIQKAHAGSVHVFLTLLDKGPTKGEGQEESISVVDEILVVPSLNRAFSIEKCKCDINRSLAARQNAAEFGGQNNKFQFSGD